MVKSFQNMAMLQLAAILSLVSRFMCQGLDFVYAQAKENKGLPSPSENKLETTDDFQIGKKGLFYQDDLDKSVLMEWDTLPDDLRAHIREDSYEILTPTSHFHAPFFYVYDEPSSVYSEPTETWIFIFLHGFVPPRLKVKGHKKFGSLKVLATNIITEAQELNRSKGVDVRYILFCPSYAKESRQSFSKILLVIGKIFTAFFKMLENDSGMKYYLFFIGHSMGGVIIRLLMEQDDQLGVEEVQRYMFRHRQFSVQSVVTIASPHCGIKLGGVHYQIQGLLQLGIVSDLAITDEDQRLLTLAFDEFREGSYIPRLGRKVVYYAIRGDNVVDEESALGLQLRPPSIDVLSISDVYQPCRQLSSYGPHFPYTIDWPERFRTMDKNSGMLDKVQVLMSSSTPQRFLVDLTSRATPSNLHQLAKGSDSEVAENFTLYYHHVASKVVQPLESVALFACSE